MAFVKSDRPDAPARRKGMLIEEKKYAYSVVKKAESITRIPLS